MASVGQWTRNLVIDRSRIGNFVVRFLSGFCNFRCDPDHPEDRGAGIREKVLPNLFGVMGANV
jgi:hypothetical protein